MSTLLDLPKRMRSCLGRATAARSSGDLPSFCRHIEEYLFLSHASVAEMRQRLAHRPPARDIPRLAVACDHAAIVTLIRDSLLELGYAAHVERAPLPSIDATLDRLSPGSRCVVIFTLPLASDASIAALLRVSAAASARGSSVLVLAHDLRRVDADLALASGASGYARFPADLRGFSNLIARIEMLLSPVGNPLAV